MTNGVHTATWLARRVRVLLDKHLGEKWMENLDDPETWIRMDAISDRDLWETRIHLKRKLVLYVMDRTRQRWMKGGYHPIQAILVFRDLDRLLELINRPNHPVQIIFAGKAHPADEPGKMLIQEVYRIIKKAENGGRLVFLEDYDLNLARYLVQGVDVWMNNPRRPNEASGTSGMKAALNGALNFSVLDGWWREAYNGSNGWAIGPDADLDTEVDDETDAESLYDTLENQIIPLYYNERNIDNVPVDWMAMVKESMRTITPQFSTRRMLKEYIGRLYLPVSPGERLPEHPLSFLWRKNKASGSCRFSLWSLWHAKSR